MGRSVKPERVSSRRRPVQARRRGRSCIKAYRSGETGKLPERRRGIALRRHASTCMDRVEATCRLRGGIKHSRSEEHTSELQSLMRISYAVFCLKKKKRLTTTNCRQHIHIHQFLLTLYSLSYKLF